MSFDESFLQRLYELGYSPDQAMSELLAVHEREYTDVGPNSYRQRDAAKCCDAGDVPIHSGG